MKKVISGLMIFALALNIFTGLAYANKKADSSLDKKEINLLINKVGLTEEEIALFPVEVLRDLIAKDAKKLVVGERKDYDLTSEESTKGEPEQVSAQLSSSDITLSGAAFTVTSDRPGFKKIYLYGDFKWKVNPLWKLTDKMTIGYPSTTEWFLPMNNGLVQQHSSRYSHKPTALSSWTHVNKSQPSDWTLGGGVAASFDLIANSSFHEGWMSQMVYVDSTKRGTTNIRIEYGHRIITPGTIGVNVYKDFGLGITPETRVETLAYGLTVSY